MSLGENLGIDDLHAFGLIVAAGGVTAAARRFGAAKATLSRSLARLEAAAGGPLFVRMGKGLRLTPLGNLLRPSADAAIEVAREAEAVLREAHGEPKGPLRVAASALASQHVLAPVIAALARRHPAIETTLHVVGHGPDPVATELDVVLRTGRPEEPHLVARKLLAAPLRLYAARASAADLHDIRAVEALGRIVVDVPGMSRDWRLHNAQGRTIALTCPPLAIVGDPAVAFAILQSGAGVALLPAFFEAHPATAAACARALPQFEGPELELYASLPPRRAGVPAVRAFLDLLLEHTRALVPAPARGLTRSA